MEGEPACRSQGRRVPRIQAGDLKQDTWVHCGCTFEEVGSDPNALWGVGVLEVVRFAWTCVTQAGLHCHLWKDAGAKPGGEVQTGAATRSSQVSQRGSGSHRPKVKVQGE